MTGGARVRVCGGLCGGGAAMAGVALACVRGVVRDKGAAVTGSAGVRERVWERVHG